MTQTRTQKNDRRTINILGVRGYPAAHGGFETFAARLAPYLSDRGWTVNIYCQIEPTADGHLVANFEDDWNGVHRIHLGSRRKSSAGSIIFDALSVLDVVKRSGIDLVLGYNTAIFTLLQRIYGRTVVMNMDGIEWKRAKWSRPIKAWFYANEFVGSFASSIPIADHPEIAHHLRRHGCKRAVVIPYGADAIMHASDQTVYSIGLKPKQYVISIARIEPENSVLEIVRSFSRKPRGINFVVLGQLQDHNPYHRAVRAAASNEVIFAGAIYEQEKLASLRFHALAYVHGHQVGGTNPSLVEALGAGNAIIARDNKFNRWVAGDKQTYFTSEDSLDLIFETVLANPEYLAQASEASRARQSAEFTWELVLGKYEALFEKCYV
jgi:glycosyltransferase involved in cell wall biosynthesis